MFGISIPEITIIVVIALVLVGPEKLPDVAKSIAKLLANFRKTSDEVRKDFYNALYPPSNTEKKDKDLKVDENEK